MHHKNGTKHVRYRKLVGTPTRFKDKNGKTICIGDLVLWNFNGTEWKTIFLYDRKMCMYKFLRGCWYGHNIYTPEPYGKMESYRTEKADPYIPYCETTGETCKEELY